MSLKVWAVHQMSEDLREEELFKKDGSDLKTESGIIIGQTRTHGFLGVFGEGMRNELTRQARVETLVIGSKLNSTFQAAECPSAGKQLLFPLIDSSTLLASYVVDQ